MNLDNRSDFLKLAGLVEGGLVVLGTALAWLVGIDPAQSTLLTVRSVGVGLLATLPIFVVYGIARDTRAVAVEMLGKPLSRCRWYDLVVLAALAGVGEELLFRGVLQPWMSQSSETFGFIAANLLFGLAHAVTPVYALLATGIGMYLSLIAWRVPDGNLLSAMIAHGVYDFVAFLLIIREYRSALTDSEVVRETPHDDQHSPSDEERVGE